MDYTDVAVIGAGVLGCFAARALSAKDVRVTVIERREDVCTGVTRANTGIIYTGCDNHPRTVKAAMTVRANASFDALCRDLDVRFRRCGSLMTAFGRRAEAVLRRKLRNGEENGVPGLRLLDREETLAMEPNLSDRVTAALFAPGTGTVDPWELGIAAYENAAANGAAFHMGEELRQMERTDGGFRLLTSRGELRAAVVINCAGLSSDAVREMLFVPAVRIFPNAADYIVLDDTLQGFLRHVIFHEPEEKGKGLTLVPTVDGNILIGPTERERALTPGGATAAAGLRELETLCHKVVPALPLSERIGSFSALRPNPRTVREQEGVWVPEDRSIRDFTILNEDGLISLIGIKTPGLTCAAELGQRCADLAAAALGSPGENRSFDPTRRAIERVHAMAEDDRAALVRARPDYGEIVCHCRDVSRGEIEEAIGRGAVTLDGVKRRTGALMGRCQGGRCLETVLEMLANARGIAPEAVTRSGIGSAVLGGKNERI